MSTAKIPTKVYVLKRTYTGTCFSITSPKTQKPAMLAFTHIRQAKQFRKMVEQMQDSNRPHQALRIEDVPTSYLIHGCSLTSLPVIILNEKNKTHYIPCIDKDDDNIDDVRFHLENTFTYYSP
jgi:hypothetical protein